MCLAPGRVWFLLLGMIPSLVSGGAFNHVQDKHWTSKYDHHFKKYAKHYFGPGFDWRWFKAQGIAESGLSATASSPAGAKGIMQILPSTFEEIRKTNPHYSSIDDPHWNIAAGIYYDRTMYRRWQRRLPAGQRLNFAFASYNAGYNKIERAFKRVREDGLEAETWEQVAPFTPPETRNYVRRIRALMQVSK
jgi:soluble lytic murein transglycosylase-like protein